MSRVLIPLLLLCLAAAANARAQAPAWDVDHEKSRIGFTAYWQNAPVKGVFKTWRADIRFDPEDLAGSSVAVEIETGSADTAYADRDTEIKKADWFAIDAFPVATFTAQTFRKVGDGAFEAEGALSIKGAEQPVVLPFTIQIDGGAAAMKAEITLSRLFFKLGEGQWEKTNFIKDDVLVEIEVTAQRKE